MPRALLWVRDVALVGHALPELLLDRGRPLAVPHEQPAVLLAQRRRRLRESRRGGAPQLARRFRIDLRAGEVVGRRVADVEDGVGDHGRDVDEVGRPLAPLGRRVRASSDQQQQARAAHAESVVQPHRMSTPGLLHALLLDGKGGARALDWEAVGNWQPADGVLWLNLDYSVADAKEWLEAKSKLDAVTISALCDHDPRPRAVAHGENLLLIMRGINNNAGAEPEDMISVRAWIEPRRILTLRHRPSTSVKSLIADLERGRGPRNAAEITLTIVERMVEHVVTRVDSLGDAVAACEDRALESTDQQVSLRHELADHRRRA